MRCEIAFVHLTKSPFLSNYAEERITREILERFEGFINARVVFSKEGDKFAVRCCLYRDAGATFMVYDSTDDAYTAFNSVIKKLVRLVSRKQKKKKDMARIWFSKAGFSAQYSGAA